MKAAALQLGDFHVGAFLVRAQYDLKKKTEREKGTSSIVAHATNKRKTANSEDPVNQHPGADYPFLMYLSRLRHNFRFLGALAEDPVVVAAPGVQVRVAAGRERGAGRAAKPGRDAESAARAGRRCPC